MIVCHCHGTTDREIAGAAKQGHAASPEDVRKSCGAGDGCGGCRPRILLILASLAEHRSESTDPPTS